MEVPNVKRKDYQLIGMEDDYLSMMDDTGDTREDLKCPDDEIGNEIRASISNETDILVSEHGFTEDGIKILTSRWQSSEPVEKSVSSRLKLILPSTNKEVHRRDLETLDQAPNGDSLKIKHSASSVHELSAPKIKYLANNVISYFLTFVSNYLGLLIK